MVSADVVPKYIMESRLSRTSSVEAACNDSVKVNFAYACATRGCGRRWDDNCASTSGPSTILSSQCLPIVTESCVAQRRLTHALHHLPSLSLSPASHRSSPSLLTCAHSLLPRISVPFAQNAHGTRTNSTAIPPIKLPGPATPSLANK
jgi:hypothetical protein